MVKSTVTYEIGFLIKEDNVKQRGLRWSDAFIPVDNYFMLVFRMGPIWDFIDYIFSMWGSIDIKNKKVKINKVAGWSNAQGGPDVKNLPKDMIITHWRSLHAMKVEILIFTILSRVNSCELSMEEMCNKFGK